MGLEGLLGRVGIHLIPKLIIYGNCDSCIVGFKRETRTYQNLHDAEQVVKDFDLVGKEIRLKTGRINYEGKDYHPMRPIPLSNFRGWLERRGVRVLR